MQIGTDIVDIRRIKSGLEKVILSDEELLLFKKKSKANEFLAGRFAAKEAFLKALGLGLKGVSMKEIEVLYDHNGAPYILYRGEKYAVSIAHDGDYAIATVLIV